MTPIPPPQSNGAHPPGRPEGERADGRCLEWCPVCRTAEILRENASPELRASLAEAQHEALLTLRALIDTYLVAHPDARPGATPEDDTTVRDIPIG